MNRHAWFCLVLCLAVAGATGAQVPRIDNLSSDCTTYPTLHLELDLRAPSGELVTSLTEEAVTLVEDGREVRGRLRRGEPATGTAYLIAVDTSGSMRQQLPAIRQALAGFVQELGEQDRVGLVTINDDAVVVHPVGQADAAPPETDERAAVVATLESLQVQGQTTVLFYGVYRGLEQLAHPGLPSRKVMVLVSDGRDEARAYTADDCIARARELAVNIVGIGVAGNDPRPLLNVRKLAEETAGRYLLHEQGQPFAARMEQVRRHVASRWYLSWDTGFAGDGRTHAAQLRIDLGEVQVVQEVALDLPLVADPEAEEQERLRRQEEERRQRLRRYLQWGGVVAVLAAVAAMLLLHRRRQARVEAASQQEQTEQTGSGGAADLGATEVPGEAVPTADTAPPAKRRTVYLGSDAAHQVYTSATLQILEGPTAGAVLPLPPVTTIGREDDNSIVLDEERISRYHARISHEDGVFWLEDLASANGTVVNGGQRITGRHPLRDGQTVRIGGAVMRFRGNA